MVVQYVAGGSPVIAMFDIETHTASSLTLPPFVETSIHHYGSFAWQVSPDGKWLIGLSSKGQRAVYDMNGQETVNLPILDYPIRWMPNSHAWVEWKWKDNRTLFALRCRSDDLTHDARQDEEFEMPGVWSVGGFISDNEMLLFNQHGVHYSKLPAVRIVSVRGGTDQGAGWNPRIPNLERITDTVFSSDLKLVSLLVECWHPIPRPVRRSRREPVIEPPVKVSASVWTSTVDGRELRHVATVELGKFDTMELKISPSPVELPRILQWVPGSRKVSYVLRGRIWTVDVP